MIEFATPEHWNEKTKQMFKKKVLEKMLKNLNPFVQQKEVNKQQKEVKNET
jgi:hypothetical protein